MRTFEKRSNSTTEPLLVDHVVEDHAVVGLGDAGRDLHDLRGEADLAADEPAAAGYRAFGPEPLHGVGVLDGHAGVPGGEEGDRRAIAVGRGQFVGDLRDPCWVEHVSPLRRRGLMVMLREIDITFGI